MRNPMVRLLDNTGWSGDPKDLYIELVMPESGQNRPYIFMNSVTTLDGKLVLGDRGGSAKGLGSAIDQILMHRLETHACAIVIGSGTLRADPHINYPERALHVVVTTSGDLPLQHPFFTHSQQAVIFAPNSLPSFKRKELSAIASLEIVGETQVDIPQVVQTLHEKLQIRRLLVEGGGHLNYYFLEANLMDEVFMTLAPKIKGGAHLPTMVDGHGLPKDTIPDFELLSLYEENGELFLRYRRKPS